MKIQNWYLIIFAALFPFPLPCVYPEGKHVEILIIYFPCQHKITFHTFSCSGNPGYHYNAVIIYARWQKCALLPAIPLLNIIYRSASDSI